MPPSHKLGITLAAVLALTILPARVHASPPQYTVTVLGSLGGSQSEGSRGLGINASGQVAGYAYGLDGDNISHAVRWTGTTPTDLGTLGGDSVGFGINDSGQVAGYSTITFNHAVRWTGTTLTDLGAGNLGFAINASGQVAGRYANYSAARWSGTTLQILGSNAGGNPDAHGINASGQVVGHATFSGFSGYHAARWTGSTPTDLGTLGGLHSDGFDINDSGQVAGYSQITGGTIIHAVRWTGTTAQDLGTLGGTNSFGYGINSFGDVVGMSDIPGDASQHVFLNTGGVMYDVFTALLPGSGVTNLDVGFGHSINDSGQIAASGIVGGQWRALRLDPVAAPEPSCLALLALGFAGLASRRKRKTL